MEKLITPKMTPSRLLLLAALATSCSGKAFKGEKNDAGADGHIPSSNMVDMSAVTVPTTTPPNSQMGKGGAEGGMGGINTGVGGAKGGMGGMSTGTGGAEGGMGGAPVALPDVYAQCSYVDSAEIAINTRSLVGQCQIFGTSELKKATIINDTNGDNIADPLAGSAQVQVICSSFNPSGYWENINTQGEASFPRLADCFIQNGDSFPLTINVTLGDDFPIGKSISPRLILPFVDEANSNIPSTFTAK
jgi:hypothetical protein